MIGHYCRYFIEIAQHQSIRIAAEVLFVSPSTLSKYLQRLEKTYGVALFERIGKRLILTQAGMRYLNWCFRMDALEQECDEEMLLMARENKKQLRIAFPFMRLRFFSDLIIPEFQRRFPDVELFLYERNSSQFLPMFFQNKLDALFIYKDPAVLNEDAHCEIISDERLVLCMPKGHPVGAKSEIRSGFSYPWIDLHTLKEMGIIVVTDAVSDSLGSIEEMFERYIENPRIVMRTAAFESIAIAVSHGMGMSILSDQVVNILGYHDKIDMYSFGESEIVCQYRAFYHENTPLKREIGVLIDIARSKSKTLADESANQEVGA